VLQKEIEREGREPAAAVPTPKVPKKSPNEYIKEADTLYGKWDYAGAITLCIRALAAEEGGSRTVGSGLRGCLYTPDFAQLQAHELSLH
jgi:hypothetical protein